MSLCWESNVSVFKYAVQVDHSFSSKQQAYSNFMAAVILEPKTRKSVTTFTFSLSICHAAMGPDAMILVFCFFLIFSLLGVHNLKSMKLSAHCPKEQLYQCSIPPTVNEGPLFSHQHLQLSSILVFSSCCKVVSLLSLCFFNLFYSSPTRWT